MVQPQETHHSPLRSVMESYVNVTAATYIAKAGDRLIGVNRAGAVTVTLPTVQLRAGRTYTVKDESGAAATNNITVATEGSETIDGSATDTISQNYGSKAYYSDGSNWFTVPLLAAAAHTLASHSSEAHSELSGVGTGDHHVQLHQAAHNSAGGDALKLDDLYTPDDNTDLDATTSLHGLLLKLGGGSTNFLRADGTWSAPGAGPSQATQAALEAETNENTYPPPDLIKHSPGVAKGYCRVTAAGALGSGDYNVASVTDTGTGDHTIVWATDFADGNYVVEVQLNLDTNTDINLGTPIASLAVGSAKVLIREVGVGLFDAETGTIAFGDQ